MRLLILVMALVFFAGASAAQTLVVGNKEEDTVSFFHLESGERAGKAQAGPAPHEVAVSPDGRLAAVVAFGGSEISIYNIAGMALTGWIDLGPHTRPHGIHWLSSGEIVATTQGSDHVVIADPESQSLLHAIPTGAGGSHMVAVSPDERTAYVANTAGDSVSVIDLVRRVRTAIVPAGDYTEAIAVSPDGAEVWAGSNNEHKIMIFEAATMRRLGEVATGRVPIRVAFHPDGAYAVTSNAGGHSLTVIDAATRQVIRTVPTELGGEGVTPVTILFSDDGSRLYVAHPDQETIAEYDTETWQVTRTFRSGAGSDGLGLSPVNARQ